MMKISFKEGSGQSKAPSQPRASTSQVQEEQSAPPPSIPSLSADLETKIQSMIDQAVSGIQVSIQNLVNKVVSEIQKSHHALLKDQEKLDSKLDSLFDCYDFHSEILTSLQEKFQTQSTQPINTEPPKSPSSVPIIDNSSPLKSTPILNDDKGGENKEEEKIEEVAAEVEEVAAKPTVPSEVAAEHDMAKVAEIAAEYAEPDKPQEQE